MSVAALRYCLTSWFWLEVERGFAGVGRGGQPQVLRLPLVAQDDPCFLRMTDVFSLECENEGCFLLEAKMTPVFAGGEEQTLPGMTRGFCWCAYS